MHCKVTESICSPAICAKFHLQRERRQMFARIIRADIRVRVIVNMRAKTTPRTTCANYSRQCESGIRV